jgi:hypothetical protein
MSFSTSCASGRSSGKLVTQKVRVKSKFEAPKFESETVYAQRPPRLTFDVPPTHLDFCSCNLLNLPDTEFVLLQIRMTLKFSSHCVFACW